MPERLLAGPIATQSLHSFSVCADEVVPKKLAETKKFAGQKIVQVRWHTSVCVCAAVCAAVIKDEEHRNGSAGQTNTMHALWVLTGRRLAPCHGRGRVVTDCKPRASPFPLAAGVWRPACGAAVRAQVIATLTRRQGWPRLAPLHAPGRIDKGARSSGHAQPCQHLHQALTGAWRRM